MTKRQTNQHICKGEKARRSEEQDVKMKHNHKSQEIRK